MSANRIEKHIVLRAPLARVWSALSDSRQFGKWFGASFDGPFIPGSELTGRIVLTSVDPEVAKLQKPHEGKTFMLYVERIEPMSLIAFRWHPFAIDPATDYSNEPMTLIEFKLQSNGDNTELTVIESGFETIPASRRADALRANDAGWSHQMKLIEKYLSVSA